MKINKIPSKIYDIVTIEWIRNQMKVNSITQQQIANDMQLSRFRVSDLLSKKGRNPLSTKFQKLAFWFYFNEL